jgi:hypothetical protein
MSGVRSSSPALADPSFLDWICEALLGPLPLNSIERNADPSPRPLTGGSAFLGSVRWCGVQENQGVPLGLMCTGCGKGQGVSTPGLSIGSNVGRVEPDLGLRV